MRERFVVQSICALFAAYGITPPEFFGSSRVPHTSKRAALNDLATMACLGCSWISSQGLLLICFSWSGSECRTFVRGCFVASLLLSKPRRSRDFPFPGAPSVIELRMHMMMEWMNKIRIGKKETVLTMQLMMVV